MSTRARRFAWTSGVLLVLAFGQCMGFCWIPGLDVLFFLAVGWLPFVHRVGPQITVQWDLLASTLVYAGALLVGSHLFLRWLHRAMRRPSVDRAGDTEVPAGAWKWRWTLGGFAIFVLMFAAGTAAVGIAHQAAWLARSPEPFYRPHVPAARIKCATNLRVIGQGLAAYAERHGGQYPDDFATLLRDGDLEDARVFICAATDDAIAEGLTPELRAAELLKPGHCSFIYFGKGVSASNHPRRVIAVEPQENHDGEGINVLFSDGGVEWLASPEAETLLIELGFERVEVAGKR